MHHQSYAFCDTDRRRFALVTMAGVAVDGTPVDADTDEDLEYFGPVLWEHAGCAVAFEPDEHRLAIIGADGTATTLDCRAITGMSGRSLRDHLADLRCQTLLSIEHRLRAQPDGRIDLDEAGEAVELGEPRPQNEHTPRITAVQLDAEGAHLEAVVYHPVDVNEEAWTTAELQQHLSAEDAARLLEAVERVVSAGNP